MSVRLKPTQWAVVVGGILFLASLVVVPYRSGRPDIGGLGPILGFKIMGTLEPLEVIYWEFLLFEWLALAVGVGFVVFFCKDRR